MNLLNIHEARREDRNYFEIYEQDQIIYLVNKYFTDSLIKINEFPQEISVDIKMLSSGECLHLTLNQLLPPEFEIREYLVISTVNGRYVEVVLKKGFFDGKEGVFDIVSAKIANNCRQDARIDILNQDFVAENFQINKHYIDSDSAPDLPFIHEVINALKLGVRRTLKGCEFCFYDKEDGRRDIQAVQDRGKPLYIEDTGKDTDNNLANAELLNYKAYLGSRFEQEMELLGTKKIKSLLVIPVVINNLNNSHSLIGCLRMTSNSGTLASALIPRLYSMAEVIINSIQKRNALKFKIAQRINNISKTGLQIHIDNEELAHQLTSNPEELVLDIKTDGLFRFSFYAKVINMFPSDHHGFNVGILILEGYGQKSSLKQWCDYVEQRLKNLSLQGNIVSLKRA